MARLYLLLENEGDAAEATELKCSICAAKDRFKRAATASALVLCVSYKQVLRAVDLLFDCEAFLVHFEGLWILLLAFVHVANVAIGGGHRQVVRAEDLQLDIEGSGASSRLPLAYPAH